MGDRRVEIVDADAVETAAAEMGQGGHYALAPELASSSIAVAVLDLSEVRLFNDARFPWVLLIPRRPGIVELFDLARADQRCLVDEIALVAAFLKATTGCAKINIASIGNMVSQLHVHLVARSPHDGNWPVSPWDGSRAEPYQAEAWTARARELREALTCWTAASLSTATSQASG
jgi:diadenosine tetraphosphate (Ap4A) HIT family hydrolase